MSLQALAYADNKYILENANGFSSAVKLTRPSTTPSVAAVLTASVAGTNGTVIPAGTRWNIGSRFYAQNASVTIALGVGTITVTAEASGVAGNLDNGAAIQIVTPISGLFGAAVIASTVTPGADAPAATIYNLNGFNLRIGVAIDVETGLLIAGNKTAITVHLSNFSVSNLPDNDWLVEATDITGVLVKGKATDVMLDRALGFATILFKK